MAPLFAALNTGSLDALLRRGVTILERGQALGGGSLGRYSIHSDSSPEALLDIVLRCPDPRLASLRSHPAALAVAKYGSGSVSLEAVGRFLEAAGTRLCKIIAQSDRGRVMKGATAHWVQRIAPDLWRIRYSDDDENMQEIDTENVVLATGAHQPLRRLETELVAGTALLPGYSAKLMQSDDVLAADGSAKVAALLHGKQHPRVVIVGGSTSAASVALKLLNKVPEVQFGAEALTLLHRKPLRIFYETEQDALRDGYTEFTPDDVCSLTGRVFRLSGFRLDARELIMQIRGLAGRAPEPRIRALQILPDNAAEARKCLDAADLIIAAFGYAPRLIPVFDQEMHPVDLLRPNQDRWSAVDTQSRVLTAEGIPLEGLFAIGLAVGPGANPAHGGEIGFRGQVNSLWLWQHTIGQGIVRQVLARTPRKDSEQLVGALHGSLATIGGGVRARRSHAGVQK